MNTGQIIFFISKVLLGLVMILFGLNKFLGFISVAPPSDQVAQTFLSTMFSSYLFKLVAVSELVGGILLIVPRYAFLGTLILLPIMVNIIAFHFAHDLPGNGIWIVTIVLFMVILGFSKKYFQNLIVA